MDGILLFLKFLHHYLYRVRHLLVEIKQQLLAYYLGDKESGRLVGQRILTEIWRSHGEQLNDAVHQRIGVKLQLGRCGEHLGVGKQILPASHYRLQLIVALQQVNLVDDKQHGHGFLCHLCQEVGVLGGILYNISHIEQHIGVGQCTLRELTHSFLHLIVGLQHSGGVGEHYLIVVGVDYAHYAVTRSLRL